MTNYYKKLFSPGYIFVIIAVVTISCNKKKFLDAKPSSSIVVPSTLADFQSILDNSENVFGQSPVMGEESADNYYLTKASWQSQPSVDRNVYTWAPGIYDQQSAGIFDWNIPYQQVFYANVVLDNINSVRVNSSNKTQWNFIKGSALFLRAFAFYNLVSVFSVSYDEATASGDLGIILKTSSDINTNPGRASVKQTYQQIIGDLQTASALLPDDVDFDHANRPNKPAAYALLARTFLSMRDYTNAGKYADSSLRLYNTLVDYNTLSAGLYPFALKKPSTREAIYQCAMIRNIPLFLTLASPLIVDSSLYSSYVNGDIRRNIYFRVSGGINRIGWNYGGAFLYAFSGLATDELYLIRAECNARSGNTVDAMSDLNAVLSKRFTPAAYSPVTASSPGDALTIILGERRKELPFRGIRWTDIKRLNKEGANIVLTRNLDGVIYTLQPNSPLYALPIPPDEISLSGIVQNPR